MGPMGFKMILNVLPGHMGITIAFSWLEPATTSAEDQKAAETARQFNVSNLGY